MKKKNLNFLLALLAALALVFAGACSDGSDDDGSGTEGENDEDNKTAVTATNVEALLQSITNTAVKTTSDGNDYWLFASGSMSASAQSITDVTGTYYVFSVADSDSTASTQPKAGDTLDNLKALNSNSGVVTATNNPCKIDFTSLSASDWAGGSAPTSGTTGYLKVTVELADSDSYTLPSTLTTVYIKFETTNGSGWASD